MQLVGRAGWMIEYGHKQEQGCMRISPAQRGSKDDKKFTGYRLEIQKKKMYSIITYLFAPDYQIRLPLAKV